MKIDGAKILLTGASSGIGAELAPLLAQRGAMVGLVARRRERLAAVLERCGGSSRGTRLWSADLGDLALAERVVHEARGQDARLRVRLQRRLRPHRAASRRRRGADRAAHDRARGARLGGRGARLRSFIALHQDATGEGMARLLALARAVGSTRAGCLLMSMHDEATLRARKRDAQSAAQRVGDAHPRSLSHRRRCPRTGARRQEVRRAGGGPGASARPRSVTLR